MTDTPETNERGNSIEREFLACADRYRFDLGECNSENGWLQFDTDQDASYLASSQGYYADIQRWTPLIGQVLNDDKCFPQYERNALERSNETKETNPLAGIQSQGSLGSLSGGYDDGGAGQEV